MNAGSRGRIRDEIPNTLDKINKINRMMNTLQTIVLISSRRKQLARDSF